MKRTAFMAALAGGLAALGLPIKLKATHLENPCREISIEGYRNVVRMYDLRDYADDPSDEWLLGTGLTKKFFQKVNEDAIIQGWVPETILLREGLDKDGWLRLAGQPVGYAGPVSFNDIAKASSGVSGFGVTITDDGLVKNHVNSFGLVMTIKTVPDKVWDRAFPKYANDSMVTAVTFITYPKPSSKPLDSL